MFKECLAIVALKMQGKYELAHSRCDGVFAKMQQGWGGHADIL